MLNPLEPGIRTHQFVHQMLIFCGFRSLPSQSQVPDSLLRLCSEALFGAQRQVVLPLRRGFQALLSGCTILPIISCSSVAVSTCLQMMGQHRTTRVHTARDAGSVFVWVMSKNPWHSSPLSTTKASCASVAQWQVPTPSSGLHYPSSSWSVKCTATALQKVHLAPGNLVGSGVNLAVMLSLDAKNSVNRWFLLHVACRGKARTWG